MKIDALIKEAEREVRMRESVYPKWVDSGRMAAATAEQQLAAQKLIVILLEETQTVLTEPDRDKRIAAYRQLMRWKPTPPSVAQPELFGAQKKNQYDDE